MRDCRRGLGLVRYDIQRSALIRPSSFSLLFLLALPLTAAAPRIDFDREIRPIFSDKCFACHGPDEKQRQAGLRFDTKDGGYRVITPGASGKSPPFQRVSTTNKANPMPPPASRLILTDRQV